MAKIKLGFSGLTVPEQIERARLVVMRMAGNSDFPSPVPALPDVTNAANALEITYNNSRNRDKNMVAIMRLRRSEMLFLAGQLGAYVQQASNADAEKILGSGFDISSERPPRPSVAGMVHNVRVKDGSNSGKIKVDWDKTPYAVMYMVQVSNNPDNFSLADTKGFTTRTSKEIEDLTVGTKYWVRVWPLGRELSGPLSEPADIIVR